LGVPQWYWDRVRPSPKYRLGSAANKGADRTDRAATRRHALHCRCPEYWNRKGSSRGHAVLEFTLARRENPIQKHPIGFSGAAKKPSAGCSSHRCPASPSRTREYQVLQLAHFRAALHRGNGRFPGLCHTSNPMPKPDAHLARRTARINFFCALGSRITMRSVPLGVIPMSPTETWLAPLPNVRSPVAARSDVPFSVRVEAARYRSFARSWVQSRRARGRCICRSHRSGYAGSRAAAVKLVIADGAEIEPDAVHHSNGRLIEKNGGCEWRSADQVAGGNGKVMRMLRPDAVDRICQPGCAACRNLDRSAGAIRDRDALPRRLERAVEGVSTNAPPPGACLPRAVT
jgi:hypothetical protein